MTPGYSEPTRLGPWLIDSRNSEDPWTFDRHNERTGQRAIVEVHFSDDLSYGDALRAAAMGMDDPDWQALGSSRLLLRPGEGWDDQPPGAFIFWVAWQDSQPEAEPVTEAAAPRQISFTSFSAETEPRFGLLRQYPVLAVLAVIAAVVGIYLLVTVVFGGKSSTSGLATLPDGTKSVACGSGAIMLNQGDHASIPLDKASLGAYQLKAASASPVSKAAAPQGLTATVGAGSTLMLDAGAVPGQAGRVDEYKVSLSLVRGSTNVKSDCQVLIKAPPTPPSPTPSPATPTPVATAVPTTYTVVSGDTLNGIAAKQNIPADQRPAWVQQVQSLNSLTGATINVGQVLKLPPKP